MLDDAEVQRALCVMAHPDGPGAGVRSLREAWDAAVAGIPLEEHARTHPELGRALGIAA